MSTSPQESFLSEIKSGATIPVGKLAYFRRRLRNNLHSFVLRKFMERERDEGLTRAILARRIHRAPEVITRLLGAPGNWTLDTASDLLLGIAAEELQPSSWSVLDRPPRNYKGAFWLDEPPQSDVVPAKTRSTGPYELELEHG